MAKLATPFQIHKSKWQAGCGSELCSLVRSRCYFRGKIPAPVLFVGEAPGESEDALASPFEGPAGHLLDNIIAQAMRAVGKAYDYAMTNLVLCFPLEAKRAGTNEPSEEAIKCCRPRLVEFIRICKPKLIVCVGKLAHCYMVMPADIAGKNAQPDWIEPDKFLEYEDIVHPAAILKAMKSQQALMVQRAVARLAYALEALDRKDIPF